MELETEEKGMNWTDYVSQTNMNIQRLTESLEQTITTMNKNSDNVQQQFLQVADTLNQVKQQLITMNQQIISMQSQERPTQSEQIHQSHASHQEQNISNTAATVHREEVQRDTILSKHQIFSKETTNTTMFAIKQEPYKGHPTFGTGSSEEFLEFWNKVTMFGLQRSWSIGERLSQLELNLGDDAYDLYQEGLDSGQFSFNKLEEDLFAHFAPEAVYFTLLEQLNTFRVDARKDLNFEIARLRKLSRYINWCIDGNNLTTRHRITEVELYDALCRGLSAALRDILAVSQYEYRNIIEVCSYLNRIYANYQKNHLQKNVRTEKLLSTSTSKSNITTKDNIICHYCGKEGHLKIVCRKCQQDQQNKHSRFKNHKGKTELVAGIVKVESDSEINEEDLPYIPVLYPYKTKASFCVICLSINGKQTYGLMDTGATTSLIRTDLTKGLNIKKIKKKYLAANNQQIIINKSVMAPVKLTKFTGVRILWHKFKVVEELVYPVILGMDFIVAQGIIIDGNKRQIHWQGLSVEFSPATEVVAAIHSTLDKLTDSKYELTPVKQLVPLDLTVNIQEKLLKILEPFQNNLFSGKAG